MEQEDFFATFNELRELFPEVLPDEIWREDEEGLYAKGEYFFPKEEYLAYVWELCSDYIYIRDRTEATIDIAASVSQSRERNPKLFSRQLVASCADTLRAYAALDRPYLLSKKWGEPRRIAEIHRHRKARGFLLSDAILRYRVLVGTEPGQAEKLDLDTGQLEEQRAAAHALIDETAGELDRVGERTRPTLEEHLRTTAKKSRSLFSTTEEKDAWATKTQTLLDRLELRLCCPFCDAPARLEVAPGKQKKGVWLFSHGDGPNHGGAQTLEDYEIKLVDAPSDSRRNQ